MTGSVAVGIDLGTTYSAVAWVNDHGVPEVLPNAEGDRVTPSVVLLEDDAEIVGAYAQQAAAVYPDRVVEFVKRHMGEPDYRVRVGAREHSAEELSSYILAKLKHDAEIRLGRPVDRAVITVPAYFNDRERRATLRAGELAGLEVLGLVNEPTAAAFGYGLKRAGDRARVLVFDLGGGTFDVTVVDMEGRDIQVVATDGDSALGGKDWDDVLMAHVASAFRDKHGVDPMDDAVARQDLRARCVSAKMSLSRRPKVNIILDYAGHPLRVAVERETFEQLASELLARVERLVRAVLAAANTTPDGIDTVLLAGGSTRMPMVRDLLERVFGKPPSTDVNPDEAIALGAALSAALEAATRAGEAAPVDLRTHDVTSHSLGMAVLDEGMVRNVPIIQRNTRIPAERVREDVVTAFDGQTVVDLWLLQGEDEDPARAEVLGHFEFYGIPPRPAGQTRLAFTYRYNRNAIVEVEAMDLGSGQILPYRIAGGKVRLSDITAGHTPAQVIAVMDASGSLWGARFDAARAGLRALAERVLGRRNRTLALAAAPGGILLMPTDDLTRVHAALDALVPVGGGSLVRSLQRAVEAIPAEPGIARVLVLVTDGSHPDHDDLARQCDKLRANGTTVHVLDASLGRNGGPLGREVRLDELTTPELVVPAGSPERLPAPTANLGRLDAGTA